MPVLVAHPPGPADLDRTFLLPSDSMLAPGESSLTLKEIIARLKVFLIGVA